MLNLNEVPLYVGGGKTLFDSINFDINSGNRIGVIGRNGAGKSHLMKLLSGDITPDSGERLSPKNVTVLLVKQDLPVDGQCPIDFLRNNDPDLTVLTEKIDRTSEHELGEIYAQISEIEDGRYDKLAPQILIALGLRNDQLTEPMRNLSGGLRMRIGMAASLIRMPDILLLDEPTNHLDLEATQWLIKYLKQYPVSCVFVTHDVKLLMEVCNSTIHLRKGILSHFEGNYEQYCQHFAIKEQKDGHSNINLQKKIARHTEIYYKFRDLPKNRAAQAVPQLKKAEKPQKLVELVVEEPVVDLFFYETEVLVDPVIQLTNVSLGYDSNVILNNLNLSIQYGVKIGLLGRNGEGKSTLIKFLSERIPHLGGDVFRRPRLKIGYLSQELTDELNDTLTTYDQFKQTTSITNDNEIRSCLANYGFSYDKTNTLVRNLSGGEKKRLLFCLICAQTTNLIILDKPTNHLDVETRNSLVKAMNNYGCNIILVSHDWDLHEKTMQKFWLAQNGSVKVYKKGLQHYKQLLQPFISMTLQGLLSKIPKPINFGSSSSITKNIKSEIKKNKPESVVTMRSFLFSIQKINEPSQSSQKVRQAKKKHKKMIEQRYSNHDDFSKKSYIF